MRIGRKTLTALAALVVLLAARSAEAAESCGIELTQIAAGSYHTCGLKSDGSVVCWGSNTDSYYGNYTGQATPPPGTFTQIAAGDLHTCGIKPDRSVVCWGSNTDPYSYDGGYTGQATPPPWRRQH